jgi:hypothetical protein
MPPLFDVPAAHTIQQVLEDIHRRVDEALTIHKCYHYGFNVLVIQMRLAFKLGWQILAAPAVCFLWVA